MNLKTRLATFWILFIFLTLLPFFIVLSNKLLLSGSTVLYLNAVQRILGLLAFNYLFILVILGSNMELSVKLIGAKAYRIHTLLGLAAYTLIFFHPLFYAASFIPFRGFAGFISALLPPIVEESFDLGLMLGRLSFVFITLGVIVGYFRARITFLRKHWRKLHIINYLTFFMIALHALNVGSDLQRLNFQRVLLYIQIFIVILFIIRRIYLFTKLNLDH